MIKHSKLLKKKQMARLMRRDSLFKGQDEEYERQMKDFETSNVADVEDAINQKKD